ncbi:response regulator [Paenibacillus tritici]|uniref:response regulator n=1 Tax=Paenibacillus tritici TaxID=1873425 RepID=UPI001BA75C02|nr:response regulator [Paenibacillus tritici]QUL56888.1 response regulator [Paenibacillus tritici]
MPRILIVDDESVFRKGLRKMITSLDGNWEVVGEASDGYDALDKLAELSPEVLLTDIRMPGMDGIQLQQLAGGRFKDLMTVVVSGYDEFAYAQQSMRQGAKDYLMKPVEREELGRVLERLGRELAERKAQPVRNEEPWQVQPLLKRHVAAHLTESLLKGKTKDSDLELLREMGFVFSSPYFICMVIKLDKYSVEKERYLRGDASLFLLYIQQVVQEMIDRQTKGISFVQSDTEVVAVLNIADPQQSLSAPGSLGDMIRRQIRSLSNLTVTIGVSNPAEGLAGIPKAYNEAGIALLYRLIEGGDRLLDYAKMTERPHSGSGPLKWSWELLEKSITGGRAASIGPIVEQLIEELCSMAESPESIHQQICKLLLYYYELSEELDVTESWLGSKDIRKVLFDVCSLSSRQELAEKCRGLLITLTGCITASRAAKDIDPVTAAQRYISLHYYRPLSLKEVADEVFLSPVYFSNLFKQRTGVTFIEFLTHIRMEEARKKLAFTDEKIHSIAEETGFGNVRHFNRVFKNSSGLSPKEYRDSTRAVQAASMDSKGAET